ncbi:kinetoplast-associated protein [Tritrichomonas foetus]|uniref:Kinetoplast-associated protein n=1 Tax=Tritrichomonas foetus TaxID=1144522 RepID=A0A1J4J357_9EUKA|nr:kinetoplast-associated protein [Tritrichomonas foetus]|eukprot:OHS93854.1 kinetoplast-associated protein [Tritrichomonas foetus]
MRGTGTTRTVHNTYGQSKIEKINMEAKEILSQKEEEIRKFEEAVEEAEKQLAKLKSQVEKKEEYYNNLMNEDDQKSDSDDDDVDLDKLKETLDAEFQQARATHEEELQTLQEGFAVHLREAEEWCDTHAENLFTEKKAELDDLQLELSRLKAQMNENAFSNTQSKTKLFQQSKALSLQNAKRIAELDSQLSELAAVTREELREVKTKRDECFVAVQVRETEHANEIDKYRRELSQREEKYNNHLSILDEQYENEKKRYEQHLKALNSKKTNLERVLAQIEKHHEAQLQTTLNDIERMKSTIYQSQARDDKSIMESKSYVTQVQTIQRDCRHLEQEISLVNSEIDELKEENKLLQNELRHLDSGISSSKMVSRGKRF